MKCSYFRLFPNNGKDIPKFPDTEKRQNSRERRRKKLPQDALPTDSRVIKMSVIKMCSKHIAPTERCSINQTQTWKQIDFFECCRLLHVHSLRAIAIVMPLADDAQRGDD